MHQYTGKLPAFSFLTLFNLFPVIGSSFDTISILAIIYLDVTFHFSDVHGEEKLLSDDEPADKKCDFRKVLQTKVLGKKMHLVSARGSDD